MAPTYFYYWFGMLSPIIFGALVYAYIKLYLKNKNTESIIVRNLCIGTSAYFVATVPRWFLYGPFLIIRGEAIMVIGIILTSIISSSMKNTK